MSSTFHFPGSATRRRVSFAEASSSSNQPSQDTQQSSSSWRVENPLLSRPAMTASHHAVRTAATSSSSSSIPPHASPFLETKTAARTAAASPAQSARPPPPLASLSTGTGYIPSLRDEDAAASSSATPSGSIGSVRWFQTTLFGVVWLVVMAAFLL